MTDDAPELPYAVAEFEVAELPADFADIPTDELLAYLSTVGGSVAELRAKAEEVAAGRLRLFVELEGREVSYRRMAKADGHVSSTAILKALRRFHTADEPAA